MVLMAAAVNVPIGDIDLASTLRPLAFLAGDPTARLQPRRFERATLTPDGPGVVVVTWVRGERTARVATSGDGDRWLLERAPRLLGCEDDVAGFSPDTPAVRALWRQHRGLRLTRTGTLWHDLACLVVQQRINGLDAAAQWRRLVRSLGSPAPGRLDLWVPPSPAALARLEYHDLHRFGIERRRAETLTRASAVVSRLHARVDAASDAVLPHLRGVPGVGPWTGSFLAAQTWAEQDTVIVGDYGIPSTVAWALAREEKADDARLAELLEPHRPHRFRVIRLASAAGRAPRRHPRGRRTDIRAM